jgi:D-hexose-6-phosphate mutarotase
MNELREELKRGICVIDFLKVDGSRRVMKCTQNQEYIREHETQYEKKTDRVRTENENLLVVFDTEKNDWRSIRVDSISYWNPVEEQ